MRLVAERRRHHPPRRIVPVLVEILALVERQVLDQRLAVDPHPLLPRPPDRLVRLLAAHVHDVERHPGGVGDHDRPVRRLALDLGRPRIGVALGAGQPLLHVLLLQLRDDVAVLGMHQRQRPELGAALERRVHLVVLDHQRALVGHEVLEGVDPALHHRVHLAPDPLVPAGDRHVVADVDADLRRSTCGPTRRARSSRLPSGPGSTKSTSMVVPPEAAAKVPDFEGLGRRRAHERHLEMGVRVDPARDHVGVGGVDLLVALQVLADRLDRLALDQHVRLPRPVGGDDRAVPDDLAHAALPFSSVRRGAGAAPRQPLVDRRCPRSAAARC